jgi:hypothetical protein
MTQTLTTDELRDIVANAKTSLEQYLALELLANREAQPVAVPDSLTYLREEIICNVLNDDDNSPMAHAARILAREVKFWRSQPLFTAPPAAPVNPELTGAPAVNLSPDFEAWFNSPEAGLRVVNFHIQHELQLKSWNACCAAMLAQPVSQGYKLPDNVREALTLALQAMEFMGDILNNIDAVCTEDVEYVTPAFNAVRVLLAAAPEGGNG